MAGVPQVRRSQAIGSRNRASLRLALDVGLKAIDTLDRIIGFMLHRRFIAFATLAVLSLTASGVTLELHHDDACGPSHSQSSDCRTCYLIMVGRTAVAETPLIAPIGDEFVCAASPITHDAPIVGSRHTSAAPRAPPTV